MIMELYYKYQPVTWWIGVIEADPKDVARIIQPRYIPDDVLRGIRQETGFIDDALASMEPLGPPDKFLLMKTCKGHTVLFVNGFFSGVVELPTWNAGKHLDVSAYTVHNIPNTISPDHRSGAYGARTIEFRTRQTPFNKEPEFGVHLVNDAGKWHFDRFGAKRPFEDEKAYRSYRKTDRFTVEMLVKYCRELGIPVYDRDFYSNSWVLIERILKPGQEGITYEEAAVKFRIEQDNPQGRCASV